MSYKPTSGDLNFMAALRRTMEKAWWGKDNGAAQAPLALNNESVLALNAAGTGTVELIKANASDLVELPNGLSIPTGKAVTFGTASQMMSAVVTISAADIVDTAAGKFGHAAGYPLVADPGAGKVVELISVVLSYTHSVAAFTAGGNTTVNINGGAALTGVVAAAAFAAAGASSITELVPLAATCNVLTANKGLNLVTASAFTQPGTAAGSIKAFVNYRVHTL